jgi:CysZ protein
LIISSIRLALSQLFAPKFRGVLWKSLGLTIALLVGLWFTFDLGFSMFLIPMLGADSWAATILSWIMGAGLIVGMGFLIAPATSIFGGLFIDDIAAEVERKHYPNDRPGQPLPTATSLVLSLKFTVLVIATNLLALLLLLVPGVNLIVFFAANGYLLGREYFQFVALRFMSVEEVDEMRQHFSSRIFLAGLVIAGFLAIPLVNLLTPLFAAAFMTHVFKKMQRQ